MREAKTAVVFAPNSDAEFGAGTVDLSVAGRRFLTQKSRRILTQNSVGRVGRSGRGAEFAPNSAPFSASENGGRA